MVHDTTNGIIKINPDIERGIRLNEQLLRPATNTLMQVSVRLVEWNVLRGTRSETNLSAHRKLLVLIYSVALYYFHLFCLWCPYIVFVLYH